MARTLGMFATIILLCSTIFTQNQLLDPKLRDLLHEGLSGELAKEHVIQITRYSRVQGSRQYRVAANYTLSQLKQFGFSDKEAYREMYKSDGKTEYQTWQSPSGFDMEWAELRMVEPYNERIVGFPEVAMSLMTYSNAGKATAELVFVGAGTSDADYSGKDVEGKIVLATGYGGSVHRLAVLKYGALAVVCYLDDDRAKEYPDMLAYTGMWPRSEELSKTTFGFNLTNRQGEKLRKLLASGQKVVVNGEARGIGLEPYFMDVVVANIRGSEKPDEEIIFSAHLDHPKESANDNASGSAALLDIARTLKEMIDSGRIPRPKRSIRFLWVPEWYGTMAYIDKHKEMRGVELGGKVLANLNMDMVGENLELLHSKLIITRNPDSIPSALDDVMENMAQMVDRMEVRTPRGSLSVMNYRITPYSGGSDHMMFIDRKIPGVMFSHDPDYTHHTSEDTPDKVDPVELERCEIIAAAAALYLANLSENEANDLLNLVFSNSSGRLNRALSTADALLVAGVKGGDLGEGAAEAENFLKHTFIREQKTLRSVLNFNDGQQSRELVELMLQELVRQFEALQVMLNRRVKAMAGESAVNLRVADTRVPVRMTRGPLDFGLPESRLSEEDREWYAKAENRLSGSAKFELANFIDGQRNITQIRDALSAEFGPVREDVVRRYLDDLVKAGVVAWQESGIRAQ